MTFIVFAYFSLFLQLLLLILPMLLNPGDIVEEVGVARGNIQLFLSDSATASLFQNGKRCASSKCRRLLWDCAWKRFRTLDGVRRLSREPFARIRQFQNHLRFVSLHVSVWVISREAVAKICLSFVTSTRLRDVYISVWFLQRYLRSAERTPGVPSQIAADTPR